MRKTAVRYVDLGGQTTPIADELMAAIRGVFERGNFILGEEVALFEQAFASRMGVRHAIAVGSGTDALILALRALGIGAGDEVITAANSFVASASAIAMVGARPVFADIRDDYNLDPDQVARSISDRTRAILPVHLTGRPADIESIVSLARRHSLCVIEDCAQAVGARYGGRPVGTWGDAGCFSLHPLKTLNACGDGGVIVTGNDDVATRLKELRNLGLRTRDECVTWSANSRLDTIQAAILLVKLKYLDEWTRIRRANADHYRGYLANVPEVRCPAEREWEWSVYHTFMVEAHRRDQLQAYLANEGIESAIHYPIPIHLQPAASELGYKLGDLPVTEKMASRILSLPIHQTLREEHIAMVAGKIAEFYAAVRMSA